LSEHFSPSHRLPVNHRANWLIHDAENAFLQARVELPLIKEILAIDAALYGGRETDRPFEPQQFSGDPSVEFSIN
jgi:hypothetical protein